MAVDRNYWLEKIHQAWSSYSIVWLSGVRQAGKSALAQMLPDVLYLNCGLPSAQSALADPEQFWSSCERGTTIVLDEIHRIEDSESLLKVAAEKFRNLKILTISPSRLLASEDSENSIDSIKQQLRLPPVLWSEVPDWISHLDIDRRLLRGGLPEALAADELSPTFYSEWLDGFYARDVLELFNIGNRKGFLTLLRILLRQSSEQLDYTQMAKLTGLSRITVKTYIDALQRTNVIHLVQPYSAGGRREIVSRPKCYGFDTGFVCFEKGWDSIRNSDRDILWRHLVLDELLSRFDQTAIHYWQDKSNREVDFVARKNSDTVDVFACKVSPDELDETSIAVFRKWYPKGENYIVSPMAQSLYQIHRADFVFKVCSSDVIGARSVQYSSRRPSEHPQENRQEQHGRESKFESAKEIEDAADTYSLKKTQKSNWNF